MATKTLADVVDNERTHEGLDEARQGFFDVGWPPAVAHKDIDKAGIKNHRTELGAMRQKLSTGGWAKDKAKGAATGAMDLVAVDPVEKLLTSYANIPQVIDLSGRLTSLLNASGLGAVGTGLQAAAPVLGPVGLAAFLASMVMAGVSAYKTHKHYKRLLNVYNSRQDYSPACCFDLQPLLDQARIVADNTLTEQLKEHRLRNYAPSLGQTRANESRNSHLFILDNVLPYIIAKKKAKFKRKAASAAGLGILEGLRAKAKGIYKGVRGTRGDHRGGAAAWIAYHWMQHECVLCHDIALELCGDTGPQMRFWQFKDVARALAEKMKSV